MQRSHPLRGDWLGLSAAGNPGRGLEQREENVVMTTGAAVKPKRVGTLCLPSKFLDHGTGQALAVSRNVDCWIGTDGTDLTSTDQTSFPRARARTRAREIGAGSDSSMSRVSRARARGKAPTGRGSPTTSISTKNGHRRQPAGEPTTRLSPVLARAFPCSLKQNSLLPL
jgi:hypothetical protein